MALISDLNGIAGQEICFALASLEFSLLVNGSQEDLYDLMAGDFPGKILAMPFDYAAEDTVEQMLSAALDIFGHVDVLVNNIHHRCTTRFNELTDKEWQEAFQRNILGSVHVCRATARLMEALGYGKIINITSSVSLTGQEAVTASTGAALHSLTRTIARDLAPFVRANTVACGLIEEDWFREEGEEVFQELVKGIPLKRFCQPADVADLVSFLATGADFMTGQLLVLDGGENMR